MNALRRFHRDRLPYLRLPTVRDLIVVAGGGAGAGVIVFLMDLFGDTDPGVLGYALAVAFVTAPAGAGIFVNFEVLEAHRRLRAEAEEQALAARLAVHEARRAAREAAVHNAMHDLRAFRQRPQPRAEKTAPRAHSTNPTTP